MEANYFTILYWFCHTSTWIRHRYTCVPHPEPSSLLPPRIIPLGHPSAPAPSILYPASNLDWRFVSYMRLYMFQCHSPKSSHPFPQSPKDCSIHLCLFCCLIYRVIFYHLFKFHIYTLVYCIGVSFVLKIRTPGSPNPRDTTSKSHSVLLGKERNVIFFFFFFQSSPEDSDACEVLMLERTTGLIQIPHSLIKASRLK